MPPWIACARRSGSSVSKSPAWSAATEIVDGHLRLKAARKLGITEIPVILCDEWTPAQVKAFRLMVNRSVTWADWDEELLAFELEEIQESDFDLSLTGFDPGEIDQLLALEDEEKANAAPPLPESAVSQLGDLWVLGSHRVLCGDATTAEAVARLLVDRKPRLMVTDPPYGIELITSDDENDQQTGWVWEPASTRTLHKRLAELERRIIPRRPPRIVVRYEGPGNRHSEPEEDIDGNTTVIVVRFVAAKDGRPVEPC